MRTLKQQSIRIRRNTFCSPAVCSAPGEGDRRSIIRARAVCHFSTHTQSPVLYIKEVRDIPKREKRVATNGKKRNKSYLMSKRTCSPCSALFLSFFGKPRAADRLIFIDFMTHRPKVSAPFQYRWCFSRRQHLAFANLVQLQRLECHLDGCSSCLPAGCPARSR